MPPLVEMDFALALLLSGSGRLLKFSLTRECRLQRRARQEQPLADPIKWEFYQAWRRIVDPYAHCIGITAVEGSYAISKWFTSREIIIMSCWWWWGPSLPLPRLPLTPSPPPVAVVWVVVFNQKIAVAISNSFYDVSCPIVVHCPVDNVHIPNFIQIGQKT